MQHHLILQMVWTPHPSSAFDRSPVSAASSFPARWRLQRPPCASPRAPPPRRSVSSFCKLCKSFCKLHRCHPRPDSCPRLGSSSLPLCMKLPNCPTWLSRSSANSVFLLDNSCIFDLSDKCGSRAFYVCQARRRALRTPE